MKTLDEITNSRRLNRAFWNEQVKGVIARHRAGISSPHNPDYSWWKQYGEKVVRRHLDQRRQFNFLSESLGGPPESSYKD